MWNKFVRFMQKPAVLISLWMGIAVLRSLMVWFNNYFNNFKIFKASFFHGLSSVSLYAEYPSEHTDIFLYGIPFTALIAPFSVLPMFWGLFLWCVVNCGILLYSIYKLELKRWQNAVIILITLNDLYTVLGFQQYSISLTGFIILSFVMINKQKDFWGAFFIALGTVTKIYGIVGLAFFFFSKNKIKFSASFLFWLFALALLPMLYYNPSYVVDSYKDWLVTIMDKNSLNMFCEYTNISLLGMVRKISHNQNYSDLILIIPGIILFCLPYLRINQYKSYYFKLSFLASALLFLILFSTSSESCGYFVAMIAIGIWFVTTPTQKTTPKLNLGLLLFAIVLTSLSITDLCPRYIKYNYVIPYSLKALPCAIIWLKIIYEQLSQNYTTSYTKSS